MPLAEVDSTQRETVPQLMDTPNGGIVGGESVEVPSLDVFESSSVTDQSRSSESDDEIPAPSATTRSLQGEMSPDLGSKFVRYRPEESFAALDVTDGEKEDVDFPGATSDESSAVSELTNTATPTPTRNMPITASAPATQPSPPSSKVASSVSEANDPTDEQLREAVTEHIDAAPTVQDLTIRKILAMMEERFSCSLDGRKALVKRAAREAMDLDENNESPLGDELSQDDLRAVNENSALPTDSSVAQDVEEEAIFGDTESSGSEAEGSDGEEEMSPLAKKTQREPRRTSARRALATIRMKQGVRAEKDSNRRRVIRAGGGESERSKSDSDSESEPASDADSPAKKSKPDARGARRGGKKLPPRKSTGGGGDNGDVVDGDAAALVDSDEDPAKDLDPAAKAVIQEEMDDVDEEKVKERKRIQAERLRQLEALRTMTVAQLKEATRAAQGSLMAKIKARQDEVHAALAASAKEELKRLKAEARRAAGMAVEGDDSEREGEGIADARGVDVPGVTGAGAEAPGALQVEGIVAKEEDAMAAAQHEAAVASSGACLSSEESDADGQHKGDSGAPEGYRNAKGGVTGSRGPTGKHARESEDESSGSGSSSSGSGSEESDEELEILPASSVSDKGRSSVQGTKPNANRTGPARGGTGSSVRQQAAGRALAALPKAIRFTSPNTADKSRAANRRQLVASARNVANDRWAAQLGYRDSREHIRDLKYMELKRRQQAQVEREQREKENAALAARLLEYAAHAEDNEKEFGEAEADGSPEVEAPESKASDDSTAGIPDPPAQPSDAPPPGSEGGDAGPVPQGSAQAGGESNPLPPSSTPKTVADTISAEGSVEDSGNRPDRTGTPEYKDEPDGAQGRVGEENQDGPGSDESSRFQEGGGGEAAVEGVGDPSKTMVSAPAPQSVRPPMLRTYGRKERQSAEEGSPKGGELVAAGAVADLSDESQALWREESDSVPVMPGLGAGGDDTQDTCEISLGLDVLEDDEATRPILMEETTETACPGDSNGTGSSVTGAEYGAGPSGKDGSGHVDANQAALGGTNGAASGAKRKLDEEATAVPAVRKMTVAADGSLRVAAPAQPSLATFFNKAGDEMPAVAPSTVLPASAASKASGAQKKTGIASFFGKANSSGGKGGDAVDERSAGTGEGGDREGTVDDKNSPSGADAARINTVTDSVPDGAATQNVADEGVERAVEDVKLTDVEREQKDDTTDKSEENANEEAPAIEGEGKAEEEEEASGEPKDRAAEYRAILEAERAAAKRAKKLRKSGMMDDEAEEEEEDEAVRGLGDFGFGVPASGNGTSATAGGGAKDEEEVDEEIREEDLEGIVDSFSDDEGDKDAQEAFLKDQAAAGDRQALKDMVRRVREGFGDERGGHGRSSATRGSLRLDQLTAADRSSRKEARRLGLLNSDEEWSDDEKAKKEEEENVEELGEQALGELLAREQRARHMGLSQTAQEYLESSDSEGGEDENEEGKGEVDPLAAQEEMERREEERVQKLWVKRAKRRRVLAEVEQAGNAGAAGGAGMENRGPEMLMEDEDSQAILNVLQRTNSRLSVGNRTNSSAGSEGGAPGAGEATSSSAGAAVGSGKRRARTEYAGELDAREVANGFGMGMSSMPMKRSRSDGNNTKKDSGSKPGDAIDRSFSMPQFVTSVAGFAGSARAKQAQKKASFLSRAGSLQARSGSLASGKTTVSASKFVFMSSIVGEDAGTRMGFDDASARDPAAAPGASTKGGGGMRRAEGSNSNSSNGSRSNDRFALSASATRMNANEGFGSIAAGKKSAGKGGGGGGRTSAGGGPGGSETGRLWQSLCAGSKAKSRR